MLSLPFGCVVYGSGWVVYWCRLKVATRFVDSGAFWEEIWCRPSTAVACALPGATDMKYKKKNLHIIVTCAGLGGSRERLSCEPRLAVTDTGLQATSQDIWGILLIWSL